MIQLHVMTPNFKALLPTSTVAPKICCSMCAVILSCKVNEFS